MSPVFGPVSSHVVLPDLICLFNRFLHFTFQIFDTEQLGSGKPFGHLSSINLAVFLHSVVSNRLRSIRHRLLMTTHLSLPYCRMSIRLISNRYVSFELSHISLNLKENRPNMVLYADTLPCDFFNIFLDPPIQAISEDFHSLTPPWCLIIFLQNLWKLFSFIFFWFSDDDYWCGYLLVFA